MTMSAEELLATNTWEIFYQHDPLPDAPVGFKAERLITFALVGSKRIAIRFFRAQRGQRHTPAAWAEPDAEMVLLGRLIFGNVPFLAARVDIVSYVQARYSYRDHPQREAS
jgi:hypothetical protein